MSRERKLTDAELKAGLDHETYLRISALQQEVDEFAVRPSCVTFIEQRPENSYIRLPRVITVPVFSVNGITYTEAQFLGQMTQEGALVLYNQEVKADYPSDDSVNLKNKLALRVQKYLVTNGSITSAMKVVTEGRTEAVSFGTEIERKYGVITGQSYRSFTNISEAKWRYSVYDRDVFQELGVRVGYRNMLRGRQISDDRYDFHRSK